MFKNKFVKIKQNLALEYFLNYLLLFVILIVSLWATYTYVQYKVDLRYADKEYVQLDSFFNSYLANGMEEAVKKSSLRIEYIEYLDENLTIIDAYGSPHPISYEYDSEEFDKMLTDYYYEVIWFYPYDYKDDIFLLRAPDFFAPPSVSDLIIKAILIYSVFLLILLFVYSKITVKRIIEPIQMVNRAVNQIANGNYKPVIDYDSLNELGQLKNTILNMGTKIDEEIQLREQSEKSRKQLILDISHDLKTPLTNIRGYAETIYIEDSLHPESLKTYIDIIRSNSIRADLLIHDLFELSKLENGEMNLNLLRFDICENLRRMLILHIPELETEGMSYSIDIPSEKIFLNADRIRIDRAIGNLIINSIKYSGKGTHLLVKIIKRIDYVDIIIQDNGLGMPPEFIDVIFNPFVRLDQSRNIKSGGSGLGLAITKSIIEQHVGTIELDSSYDEGCKFTISLPIDGKQNTNKNV